MAKFLVIFVFILLPLALLGTPVFLALSAIQDEPLVREVGVMRQADVGRIKSILEEHDPRTLKDGETRHLQLTEHDLNMVLNSALPYSDRQQWQLQLSGGEAVAHYTLKLPSNPLGSYLNFSARLVQDGSHLAVRRLSFGDTALPGWLLNPVIFAGDHYLRGRNFEYRELMAALKMVQIEPQVLQLEYQWDSQLAAKIQATGREFVLPAADRERILAYYGEIARKSRSLAGTTGSLDRLLQPLFKLALQRTGADGDAQAENRTLLLALGLAIQGSSIRHLVGEEEGAAATRPGPMKLTLGGRGDLAQHFSISAAIAAAGGSALADTIGVFKEVDDSRGGSGFSFADLLADRAGVSLAEAAMGSRAAFVQQYMSADLQEAGYMPAFDQLPEGLMELEFKSRYEDLDSASFDLVNREIQRRIGSCELYRD